MDKSTFRHRVSVASSGERSFHAFVRSDDGTVEHYWPGEEAMFGPEELGGHFDTDPVAAWRFSPSGSELHLIGRSGSQLLDWTWSPAPQPGSWLGQPTVLTLPGLAVADPEVIGVAGEIHVFAPSLDGPMRRWSFSSPEGGWSDPEVMTGAIADHATKPCAVSRAAGGFDVFSIDRANGGLRRWFNDGNEWHSEARTFSAAGQKLVGSPAAVAPTERRLDVFAVRIDGVPVHWGFDGRTWFDEEIRLGSPGLVPGDLKLVSAFDKQLTFVARTRDPDGGMRVLMWSLDPTPPGEWRGPQDVTRSRFPVTTWLSLRAADISPQEDGRQPLGQMDMLTRGEDGSFALTILTLTAEDSIDGRPGWEPEELSLPLEEPPGPPATFTPAIADPDLLARRADDLVLLGVRWNDAFEVVAGSPGELVALAGAQLTVTLPPQHVAEEVVAGEGHVDPAVQPQFTGGVPVWSSSSAGASRVVVALDEGTRWPLTVEGMLDALRHGHLLPAANLTDSGTQLELPFRLLMTPFHRDDAAIALDHSSVAAPGPAGTVGLWNTRIAAEGTDRTAPAGLTLRPLGADTDDPFRSSLSGGMRGRILLEEPTARIDRLRLSSLGASFTVAGSWETFAWDHVTTLGRDDKVRTATQGVLYPFGNRAMYVETSERRLDSTPDGAIAHLRKHAVLIVTEPVRRLPATRAFPFTEVRLQKTLVDFARDPEFKRKEFGSPAAAELMQLVLTMTFATGGLRSAIESGGVGAIPVEDLAFIEGLTIPEAAQAAATYVADWVAIKRLQEKIDALDANGAPAPDIFFVPTDDAGPIRFPVQLAGPSGEVHVDLPVVFVADIRMPEGLLHPAYSSLEDPDIFALIRDDYRDAGDGVAAISPARINMVGAAETKPTDTPEVRSLHIVGEQRDGGIGPRLGTAPDAAETVPPEERWAFEMALTELSTLAGHQDAAGTPILRVALSPELLSGSPDPGLLFLAPAGAEALTTAFSRNSARSGGLAAPDLSIDGVARNQGPVQAATFLDQVAGRDLDPKKFLGKSATLLGFSLADLVNGADRPGTPEILSDPNPGSPPKVTMRWPRVPLKTTGGAFVTSDNSTLDLEVTLAPDQQKVRCTVEDVALAFPDRAEDKKLLEVHFGTIEFLQEGSGVPSIDVSHVTTKFFGFLKLLEDLQNAVKFAGGSPAVHASDRGVTATFDLPVPDLTTGGFQLTGLSFHGAIDVPFDERPVTIGIAFASRQDPFNVSILALGGGGYVDIVLDKSAKNGIRRLEIALEFGASLEVDFVVATGEVHVMGGIRVVDDDGFSLAAYLRVGGMVEVLGLVSASVELVVTLTYNDTRNAMIGRATLVLEVDLLLVSDSVELDSGEWVLAGDESPAIERLPTPPVPDLVPRLDGGLPLDPVLGLRRTAAPAVDPEAWRAYRAAFDTEALA